MYSIKRQATSWGAVRFRLANDRDEALRIERPGLGDDAGLMGGVILALNGR